MLWRWGPAKTAAGHRIGIALTVLLIVPVAAASGCGGGGGGPVKPAANVSDYVSRILKGERPSAVIADARQLGPAYAQLVQRRATAAEGAYTKFRDSDTREGACLTYNWVKESGGLSAVSEQQIVDFARNEFTREGQAEQFGNDLKGLTDLDLTVVPSLWCTAQGAKSN